MHFYDIQKWFGATISRPLNEDQTIQQTALLEKAPLIIVPSPTLAPVERIQIYNQQYWWRFFTALQNMYPATLCLFGKADFNTLLVEPYLCAYPPTVWSLNKLGSKMLVWMRKNYKEKDKGLVMQTMQMDHAFHHTFSAKTRPFLPREMTLETKIRLQPHVALVKCDGEFFAFRQALLKEPSEYWLEHDFPSIPKTAPIYYLFYRKKNHEVICQKLSKAAFKLLSSFKKGASLDTACTCIEGAEGAEKIQEWFHEWTQEGILCEDSVRMGSSGSPLTF